jgi:SNF2 family DNA or RNA helicase
MALDLTQWNFTLPPYRHQTLTLEKSHRAIYFGLFLEMGLGKTKITIDNAEWLHRQGLIDGVLVITKKGLHLNWALDEVPLHRWKDKDPWIAVWSYPPSQRLKNTLERMKGNRDALNWFCINVESVRTDEGFAMARSFLKSMKCMLVVDESTIIANPKALQTKSVLALAHSAAYRRVLSGLPVRNSPLDLWSQCQFLDPRSIPHGSFVAFRSDFADERLVRMGTRAFNKVVGYRNLDKLTQLLEPFTLHLRKEDCLDLPPKLYRTVYVELTMMQKKIYRDLRDFMLARLKGGEIISSQSALTILMRLHQISCGHATTDDGKVERLETFRMQMLKDLVQEAVANGRKVIVWSVFIPDIKVIEKELTEVLGPGSVVTYYGATDQDERAEATHKIQKDENTKVIVSNSTGAFGNTWVVPDLNIYYSNSYSLEYRAQSEDRSHRIGQVRTVEYIDLVAKDTVDEKILTALKTKRDLANTVLDDLRLLLEDKA